MEKEYSSREAARLDVAVPWPPLLTAGLLDE